jgi:hypothetical protein
MPKNESRMSHVDHLPSQEEREQAKADKGGSTTAEHGFALRGVGIVAAFAEVAAAEALHDKRECRGTANRHPESIDEHIRYQLAGLPTFTNCAAASKPRLLSGISPLYY